ncbi:MAG: sugar phosphate isomerase/epimerase [Thermomicrobiales bacterium]|nr:sugar phosphate isomerase/epimerase [Thermomicrobiales bacterium]
MRAVSTWSLHRTLGRFVAPDSGALGGPCRAGAAEPGGLALLELPAALRAHGYDTLRICHFHLPARTPAYLASLRAALQDAGITLDALLVDDGDLTGDHAEATEAWMAGWLADAAALGAARVRLMVGAAAPTPEVIRESAGRLARLAATQPDVRVVIENWTGVLQDADSVLALLDASDGAVGLLIDLGNWRGPNRFAELARIAPRAETCHAKCHFTGGAPEVEEFQRALAILREAGYTGPLALIYDGADDDEWGNLERVAAVVRSSLPGSVPAYSVLQKT